MYQSFELLISTIWLSLDDVLICIGALLVARVLATALYWCLHTYFRIAVYESELTQFAFLSVIIVFLVSHLFGSTALTSIIGGISIGFGYALQPYILSLLAGSAFRAMNTVSKDDTILFNGGNVRVKHVGLFHICVQKDGFDTYIPNAYFQNSPLTIQKNSQTSVLK